MLVVISKEQLQLLLESEIKCWECVCDAPNVNAFEFDPKETDPKILKELGYYDDREAWIAGARIREIRKYINELNELPQFTGR